MRIRILEDTYTVGLFLEKGKVVDVQGPLAAAMIADGRAVDSLAAPVIVQASPNLIAPKVPVEAPKLEGKPLTAEEALDMAPVTLVDKAPKKPARKPAAKKPKGR